MLYAFCLQRTPCICQIKTLPMLSSSQLQAGPKQQQSPLYPLPPPPPHTHTPLSLVSDEELCALGLAAFALIL